MGSTHLFAPLHEKPADALAPAAGSQKIESLQSRQKRQIFKSIAPIIWEACNEFAMTPAPAAGALPQILLALLLGRANALFRIGLTGSRGFRAGLASGSGRIRAEFLIAFGLFLDVLAIDVRIARGMTGHSYSPALFAGALTLPPTVVFQLDATPATRGKNCPFG